MVDRPVFVPGQMLADNGRQKIERWLHIERQSKHLDTDAHMCPVTYAATVNVLTLRVVDSQSATLCGRLSMVNKTAFEL
jgi:hypothetical protein